MLNKKQIAEKLHIDESQILRHTITNTPNGQYLLVVERDGQYAVVDTDIIDAETFGYSLHYPTLGDADQDYDKRKEHTPDVFKIMLPDGSFAQLTATPWELKKLYTEGKIAGYEELPIVTIEDLTTPPTPTEQFLAYLDEQVDHYLDPTEEEAEKMNEEDFDFTLTFRGRSLDIYFNADTYDAVQDLLQTLIELEK